MDRWVLVTSAPKNFPILVTMILFLFGFGVIYQSQRKYLMPEGGSSVMAPGVVPDNTMSGVLSSAPANMSGGMTVDIPEETFVLMTRDVLVGLDALQLEREAQKKPAPTFRVTDAQGNRVTFPRAGKKFTLVNFWATWCIECRKEMPSLRQLWDKAQADQDWDLVYVNWGEPPDRGEAFLKRENLPMKSYYDPKKEVGKLFGVTGVPETYLINEQGLLIAKAIGPRDWAQTESLRMIDSFRTNLGAGVLPSSPGRPMRAEDLKKRMDSGVRDYILIDLRSEQEYNQGCLPNSFNFPPGLLMQHLGILPLDITVIFVTSDGEQAKRFAESFGRMGYPDVRFLEQGVAGWKFGLRSGKECLPG